MTLKEYAAQLTEIMDGGPGSPAPFDYPESFDGDVERCFRQGLTAAEAAEWLLVSYGDSEAV